MTPRPRNEPPPPRDEDDPLWAEPEPDGNGFAFERYDLRELSKTGVEPPQLIGHDLLYPGGVHSLSSEPDTGKTTMAWWFALLVLRDGGTVMFMDEESGPEMTYEKMAGLGASEAEIAGWHDDEALHYFPFPGRTWSDPDIVLLGAMARDKKPSLVIFDSSPAFMAGAGLDENSNGDVSRFYLRVIAPLARKDPHAAVLILDHDAKNSDGPAGKTGRYARGAGAKLAAIDVQFKLNAVQAFSRFEPGVLTLAVTKDRRGWIHPRKYRIHVRHPLEIWFTSDAERLAGEQQDAVAELTPAEEKVWGCLNENHAGVDRLIQRCQMRYGMALRRETVQRALAKLLALHLAEQVMTGGGRGNLATWRRPQPAGSDQPTLEGTGGETS